MKLSLQQDLSGRNCPTKAPATRHITPVYFILIFIILHYGKKDKKKIA